MLVDVCRRRHMLFEAETAKEFKEGCRVVVVVVINVNIEVSYDNNFTKLIKCISNKDGKFVDELRNSGRMFGTIGRTIYDDYVRGEIFVD